MHIISSLGFNTSGTVQKKQKSNTWPPLGSWPYRTNWTGLQLKPTYLDPELSALARVDPSFDPVDLTTGRTAPGFD